MSATRGERSGTNHHRHGTRRARSLGKRGPKIERVEMINPKVQQSGDIAVLTFNLIDYGAQVGDGPKTTARWNSTEVYQRINGSWKIIHSHWSYVKPKLNESSDAHNANARDE